MREPEGLLARVRQLRRAGPPPQKAPPGVPATDDVRLTTLEARVSHLEQLLEGLQDSVHRESARLDKQIAELQAQLQPAAVAAALSKDARERGLE